MLFYHTLISAFVFGSFVSFASASSISSVAKRTLVAAGGWSLSTTDGIANCPMGTASCFGNLTGNHKTPNRGENCCPSGTFPRLDCGTYVNTGQPYACCPLSNPDCRGDVEKTDRTDICANTGWALWHVPYGGARSPNRGVNGTATTLNSFCCLPGQYGYYFPRFGQDAVGQCHGSKVLPNGALPAVQDNNGDGSVNSKGNQTTTLPGPPPSQAPVCDLVSYGWSLQTKSGACTPGSNLCSYGGACCPTSLNCGTVIGASEVPVCCPPGNPDCRGDVEGLSPQVCADSSWALWHVNTNGNHFCCQPNQIGYNVPNDNRAVGFCGAFVPNGTVRSILDYVGDGSTPGSNLQYPCDSCPAPNASYPSISSAIMNPPSTLNPGVPLPTGLYPNITTYTTSTTTVYTVTSCPPVVTNCPLGQLTTQVVTIVTTYCPGTSPSGSLAGSGPAATTQAYTPTGTAGGIGATSIPPATSVFTAIAATSTPSATNVFTGAAPLYRCSAALAGLGTLAALFL